MLGNDDLGHASEVVTALILIDVIVLWAVYEEHHVGILLDGSRLTQVGELWALAVEALAALNTTVELTQCEDGDIEFLGETLE